MATMVNVVLAMRVTFLSWESVGVLCDIGGLLSGAVSPGGLRERWRFPEPWRRRRPIA